MIIQKERAGEAGDIAELTRAAFADVEYSEQREAEIIDNLRNSGGLTLSLVAIEANELIGHIAFSPVAIGDRNMGWFGLGPLSVRPAHQARGVGGSLVREGLRQLRDLGAAGCVVLGDPGYYRRFGFEPDDRLRYEQAPPEYFMRQSFKGDVPAGRVDYHRSFGTPEAERSR